MGIVPFVLEEGTSWQSLGLKGDETVSIEGLASAKPRQKMVAVVTGSDGKVTNVPIICRIDTAEEVAYVKNGGILQYVLRDLAA
jgi:aconitate hydratase